MISRPKCCVFLWVLLISAGTVAAQDRFAPAFPQTVFDAWLETAQAQRVEDDEPRKTTLIGTSVVRTYDTKDGERRLELLMTDVGEIYDVGEFLDLGPQADAYISEAAQLVAGRVIWAMLTRNEPYLRSVVASSFIRLETPFLGSKADQIMQYIREVPDLNVGNFYLTLEDGKPVLACDAHNTPLRVHITPTLDLVLQGQSVLYRDYIVSRLRENPSDYAGSDYEQSAVYHLQDRGNSFSYALPEIEYYKNARSFTRRGGDAPWVSASREQLAIPEGRIASIVANRWATLALPDKYRFDDLVMAPGYRMDLAIEGGTVERLTLNGKSALEYLGTLVGRGLPAYYNTINARREGDKVYIRGLWMVRNPDLAYEHVFRITDTFHLSADEGYVWEQSEVRVVLAVRTDHIEDLKATPTPPSGQAPIFRVRMNR